MSDILNQVRQHQASAPCPDQLMVVLLLGFLKEKLGQIEPNWETELIDYLVPTLQSLPREETPFWRSDFFSESDKAFLLEDAVENQDAQLAAMEDLDTLNPFDVLFALYGYEFNAVFRAIHEGHGIEFLQSVEEDGEYTEVWQMCIEVGYLTEQGELTEKGKVLYELTKADLSS